ncbi:MAG: sulfatase [Eubacteriales bacterium]|jgi:arylsulfatase
MSQKPNFLFIFPDQHRGDWMPYSQATLDRLGVSDLELDTPNLRKIMQQGVAFTHAVTPSPLCAPARACLASGRRYGSCRVESNKVNYDPALRSFYSVLREKGYSVGGVGKFDLNKADLYWGDGHHELLDRIGFTHAFDNEGKFDAIWAYYSESPGPYGKYLGSKGLMDDHAKDMISRLGNNTDKPTPLPDEVYCDNWVTRNGVEMIHNYPKDKPWFLQVNFTCPHDPWDVTAKMKESHKDSKYPEAAENTEEHVNVNGVRQNYAAMIENLDRNIGILINAIRERGDLDNTIIIYSSDHGEMLGDHNKYGKSKPEQGSIHVPLVIDASNFGGMQGVENSTPVEMQDIAETILDYVGESLDTGIGSMSLKPIIDGKIDSVREYCVSELFYANLQGLPIPWGTVSDGHYKMIFEVGKSERMYDLLADPFECNNIIGQYPEVEKTLREHFAKRNQGIINQGVMRAFEIAKAKLPNG